jgi:hypothetical protein
MAIETFEALEKAIKDENILKKHDLEKMSQKSVDIMIKKYANPIVLHRAQKDMRYVG